jgi:Anti-sigma-K factor rskA, C-terminal
VTVDVDHEHVQELLAGFALHALEPEDAREVEDLMATHLSGCDECRRALDEFEWAAGDLALAAGSRTLPRLLEGRIRRELRVARGQRRWVAALPFATSVALVAGLFVWNAHLSTRIGHEERRQATSAELLSAVSHPASKVLPLPVRGVATSHSQAPPELAAAVLPGRAVLYVFGSMPPPRNGSVYTVWLGAAGRYVNVAEFVPEEGSVLLAVRVDPFGYDGLLITEEQEQGTRSPSALHLAEISL